ncbi:MAG: exosortase system-associated protein, TIGR04073 family [Candidatus Aureabacteria bacterium]|nr:exosortase system-associated protein, TIGR04073 family [Candidatus Auribacterota bacterium]
MTVKCRTVLVIIAVILGTCALRPAAVTAFADSKETADSATKGASGKFGRGLVNITTGWGEMVRCPLQITRDRGVLLGATWGPLKGIAMTVIRTVGGVLETALFFYPLPGNYDPYFDPEFVFSKPAPRPAAG